MRRLHCAMLAAVAVIGFASVASAADMPLKAPAYNPPIPAVHNWTGFYVGVNAGYSWGSTDVDYSQGAGIFGNPPNPGGVFAASYDLHPNSFIGGGQIGYNYQSGNVVWGLEADIQGRHKSDSESLVFNPFQDRFTLTDTQGWLATFRGRLGYAMNNWLLYATGGLAVGKVEHEVFQASSIPIGSRSISDSDTRAGWTVGGGVEWAFAPHLSLGAEYLYVDLGASTLSMPAQLVNGLPYGATSVDFHDRSHIARVKLNYRF
jgi:outer membrane immunogenic protein